MTKHETVIIKMASKKKRRSIIKITKKLQKKASDQKKELPD